VLERRAGQALLNRIAVRRRDLDGKAALLKSLGYQSVLSRGFALVRDETGAMVRRAASVSAGAALNIEFSDGRVGAIANGGSETPKAGTGQPAAEKKPRQKSRGRGGQGSLF
jgi:exodeoxyribonuclease VII large subunit